MKFKIPKNRIVPLILFAIFSIFVAYIFVLFHIEKMAKYSYEAKLESYDSITENIAVILKQEIENEYQSIQVSAKLITKTGQLTQENITTLLPLIAKDKSFIDLAIVDENGIGYNIAGEEINVQSEEYFITAKSGMINASNKISYSADNTPVIIFAAPISDNGVFEGVLITKINAMMNNPVLFQNDLKENRIIYLVNEHKELISYAQAMEPKLFDYNEIFENGVLLGDENSRDKAMDFSEFFIEKSVDQSTYIWNEKLIGINNWSVLVGSVNTINTITGDILRLTNMMWIFITAGTILLFTVMIIFQRKSDRKVIKTLYLDPVTGGNNWYKFRDSVNKILNNKQFNKKNYAIINFDVNRFKIINDTYGYHKGDEVLGDIYQVIKDWNISGEPFTRYAADQFYIFASFINEDELIQRIYNLNERLHHLRYMKDTKIFFGIYYITHKLDSIDRMAEFASIAKINIKGSTESNISFFDDTARIKLLEEENIEKSMNDALLNDEFHVFLQPKYSAKEGTLSGAEALVRWFKEDKTLISPGFFIPVFEKNGFITQLDYYMLTKVCQIIREWLDKGYEPLPVSVNISRMHFMNSHMVDTIKGIVDNYKVPHHLIEIELTESAFLQNKQGLIAAVTELREHGFLISMDDFGAGYSSLNSLKDLPLDVVKLDGELFRMTNEVERGLTVIRNTINMAKDLHMMVVAECIETEEQVEFLCTVGCDMIQGHYFAKAMPVKQFEETYFAIS